MRTFLIPNNPDGLRAYCSRHNLPWAQHENCYAVDGPLDQYDGVYSPVRRSSHIKTLDRLMDGNRNEVEGSSLPKERQPGYEYLMFESGEAARAFRANHNEHAAAHNLCVKIKSAVIANPPDKLSGVAVSEADMDALDELFSPVADD